MSFITSSRVHIRVSAETNQGSRKTMEDFTAVVLEKEHDREGFFGVFDGHGGYNAALFTKNNLWKAIRRQREFYSSDPDKVSKAIKDGFLEVHEAMWKERDSWPKTRHGMPSTAGTTVSVVILRGRHMFVAHVGDSRVVLASNMGETLKAIPLTKDHKPDNPEEKERIESLGGEIGRSSGVFRVAWNRVCQPNQHHGPVLRSTKMESVPFLAIARSLGDLWSFNSFLGEYIVSPVPDVHYQLIDPKKDKFVVLASDGLWNAMRNKEVVHFIDNIDKNFLDLKWNDDVTHRLTCRALAKWKERNLRADNTSAVVVFFDEEDRTISPYITYSPPSDAETEMDDTASDLSRANSFLSPTLPTADSTAEDHPPPLVRENAFRHDPSSTSDRPLVANKRSRSPNDGDTEKASKRVALENSVETSTTQKK